MLLSATFTFNVRIILSDPFTDCSTPYVACVCNHYCRTNQSRRSRMVLTSRISCVSNIVSFSLNLLEFLSFDELDLFDNEDDDDGSGSRSPGTCCFPFFSDEYVGRVSGVGSGDFVPTGINSIGDVVLLVVFVPRGVEYKVGRPIGSFWRPKY